MDRFMGQHGSFVEQLMGIKGDSNGIQYDAKRDRFNMPHSADTNVRKDLNANRIVVDGNSIAIASQYPFPHQVESQLQMLLDNCTPVLIVLASTKDIQNHQLPEYFSGSATVGQIQTKSQFLDYIDLENSTEAKLFQLTVTQDQKSIEIPVVHVFNWPDHRTVSSETTSKLVALITAKVVEKRAFYEEIKHPVLSEAEKMLPVIHCKAGVGRTGQTVAALAMEKYPALSLESITKDLRASRNNLMVQTPYQMETLVKLHTMNDVDSMHKEAKQQTSRWWRSIFRKPKVS